MQRLPAKLKIKRCALSAEALLAHMLKITTDVDVYIKVIWTVDDFIS